MAKNWKSKVRPNFTEDIEIADGNSKWRFSKHVKIKDFLGREIEPEIMVKIEQDGQTVFLYKHQIGAIVGLFHKWMGY